MKFLQRRHTTPKDLPISLKSKQTYTFFSKFGLIQGCLFLILLLFAINYNNNMTMIGISFLISFYMVALIRNYKSLKDVSIVEASHSFNSEDEDGFLIVRLNQKKIRRSYPLLHLRCDPYILDVVFDEHGECVIKIPFYKENVGLYKFPMLTIYSYWPIGVSRTWVYSRPNCVVAVLPMEYKREFVGQTSLSLLYSVPQTSSVGDIEGTREVAPGERGVKIAWKQSFRRNKMMTYTYEKSGRSTTVIEWPNGSDLSVEQKLRVVSGSIGNALRSELLFQVRHPKYISNVGATERDAHEVLQTLMHHVLPIKEWA